MLNSQLILTSTLRLSKFKNSHLFIMFCLKKETFVSSYWFVMRKDLEESYNIKSKR